jgi:DNA-binding transcriptional ArsR family regulator
MANFTFLKTIFKALGNERRLKILESIERGISNPGEISRSMKVSRSTIEKHIRVLRKAGIIEKAPGLSSKGNLRIYYTMDGNIKKLLYKALDIIKND